ncbi:glycoside hydrolase family 47 protein [Amniculicola lignicola CBS 123094]|uniref:alpha-1,2-Mannosidase n=1 Tax=Amniculicola lignicola CBS 123094 TaxID=1392246 RepID=A0A6A5X4B8_9PLEO|nr:glycoside hydrolase family 47 protein [Amniculicola lignicola CBS 123094]
MLRYRRYRVFVVFALIAVVALYKFGSVSSGSWRAEDGSTTGGAPDPIREEVNKPAAKEPLTWDQRPQVAKETRKFEVTVPAAKDTAKVTPPAVPEVSRPAQEQEPTPTILEPNKPPSMISPPSEEVAPQRPDEELVEGGQGRVEVAPVPTSIDAIHWTPISEHFPVASASMIKLPSSTPKKIPRIQFEFKAEGEAEKKDRETKLETIKQVAKKSWDGYKTYAWKHDELSPTSGKFRDPFAFWGATLVDSLDTLWIMGLKTEFEEAVGAVGEIDFTTSPRPDIPLFETTIRYLGGMLAAYDISGKKYKVLLEKAVELGEILYGAFDSPNRMPQLYYFWRPTFATQAHRASNRVVLAEIGSLSVEFTRLAQLTGEHKYYDAVARITDALEAFQNKTRLPGMWPTYLDASGCKRIDYTALLDTPLQSPLDSLPLQDLPLKKVPTVAASNTPVMIPLSLPDPIVFIAETAAPTKVNKRQLDYIEADGVGLIGEATASAFPSPRPECEEQGFVSTSEFSREEFTLGGMSDSTYEYLSKEWLLLGGLVEKYQPMFEKSMDTVRQHLLFRPMLPNMEDILFSGKLHVSPGKPLHGKLGELEAENAHLTCFAGGMFAMGAKIFDRPEDLEIAKKLTEGCVFSYNMTNTGIMPEAFYTIPCESKTQCEWNKTKYYEVLDPGSETRFSHYQDSLERYSAQVASASAEYEAALAAMTPAPAPVDNTAIPNTFQAEATPSAVVYADTHDKRKRQIDIDPRGELEEAEGPPSPVQADTVSSISMPVLASINPPRPPLSHEEYVKNRIQEERLPPGVISVPARSYILRPEAIESVFYMYRITGDPYWRSAGWQMFQAVNLHTTTNYGNSAIDDVTKSAPTLNDEMESFWLAETLKYFYLLFEEESVVSLDEWVLNTEAHPFRRPE